MLNPTQPLAARWLSSGIPCSLRVPLTQPPPWTWTIAGRGPRRRLVGQVDVELQRQRAVPGVDDPALVADALCGGVIRNGKATWLRGKRGTSGSGSSSAIGVAGGDDAAQRPPGEDEAAEVGDREQRQPGDADRVVERAEGDEDRRRRCRSHRIRCGASSIVTQAAIQLHEHERPVPRGPQRVQPAEGGGEARARAGGRRRAPTSLSRRARRRRRRSIPRCACTRRSASCPSPRG